MTGKRYHVWRSGQEREFSAITVIGDRDTLEEAKMLGEEHAEGQVFGWHRSSESSWALAVFGRPFEIYIYDRQEGR